MLLNEPFGGVMRLTPEPMLMMIEPLPRCLTACLSGQQGAEHADVEQAVECAFSDGLDRRKF